MIRLIPLYFVLCVCVYALSSGHSQFYANVGFVLGLWVLLVASAASWCLF